MQRLTYLFAVAACGALVNPAQADILYVDIAGRVTVNGAPAEGVLIEAVPCAGALLPTDWPTPSPMTISTAPDPLTGANYHLEFLSSYGDGSFAGPAGTHTFVALNGAWFTAASTQLQFTFSNCPPVVVSCADVLAAYNANPAPTDPFMAYIEAAIVCREFNPGDTATAGFWANKNGQTLIKSFNGGVSSTSLANWLAGNFPYLFGASAGANNLTGKSNKDVAALYLKLSGSKSAKAETQIMATALSVYVTDSDLAGNLGTSFGFNVSVTGTGEKTHNVGALGSAIGLSNGVSYPVMGLLLQANLQKQLGTFNSAAFNVIFSDINVAGQR